MNKGQKAIAGLLGLLVVEALPVSIVSTRTLVGGIEVTYEVDDERLERFEADTLRAMRAAERDMGGMIEEGEL